MLAFGRALMANPMVLMMDEPSLGLSPLLTQELGKQIGEINREGMTILLVEQNARMGLTLSTKGYVLVNGQVAISGSSAELLGDDMVKAGLPGYVIHNRWIIIKTIAFIIEQSEKIRKGKEVLWQSNRMMSSRL